MSIKELAVKVEGQAVNTDNVTEMLKRLTQKTADVKAIQATVADLQAQLTAAEAAKSKSDADKQAEIEALKAELAKAVADKAQSDATKQAEMDAAAAKAANDLASAQNEKLKSDADKQAEIEALKTQLAQTQAELTQAIADNEMATASLEHLITANTELKKAADELVNAAS